MQMALLFCLLPLVQGTIMSISTTPTSPNPPYEIDEVDPLTGEFKQIAKLADAEGFPNRGVFHDNTALYCTDFGTFFNYTASGLTAVDLSTGKIQQGERYPLFFFMDLAYDKVTRQTFVLTFNSSEFQAYLFELLPDQTLRKLAVVLPSYIRGDSAYSSSKHIFFLNMDNHLLAVSTAKEQEGKILHDVQFQMSLLYALLYDDTFGVLYAWTRNDTESVHELLLVSVDYTTGKILKTFYRSSTLFSPQVSALSACIDKAGSAIYSVLFDSPSNFTVIHTLDLSSGKAAQVPTDRDVVTLRCQ